MEGQCLLRWACLEMLMAGAGRHPGALECSNLPVQVMSPPAYTAEKPPRQGNGWRSANASYAATLMVWTPLEFNPVGHASYLLSLKDARSHAC